MTDSSTYRTNRDLFSNHYLDDHLRETEPWSEVSEADVEAAYEEITSLWAEKRGRVDDYNEAQLEKNFIRPVFDILGIPFEIEETVMRNARRPDYGFFPSTEAADAAFDREDFYAEATAVADAKRWGRKLDTRGKEKRDFENPSYQIHRYLQETPAQWAVLTNGELWRLYYGPTSHRLDSYYEIDLPELLDVVDSEGDFEAFKEFYLFFRQEAFLPDKTGDCFLDDVYDESSIFAEELGEDLQENIYEAIRVLAEGFLDTTDELDEDDLELIHDSSLIYLYRLIFVLYAESEGRDLLPTNNEIYSGSYSLNELKLEVVENRDATQQHYQTWQTDLWDQLEELFVLIDEGSRGKGIPKDDLYIPAYNGGLFRTSPDADDSVESQFLSTHEVGDAYLAEVIELLTRHEADEGKGKVFVDYSSLDERNLGSIYEGLLEYKLDVADEPLTVDDGEYTPAGEDDDVTVEAGEVYLRTDDGERKATGSYYTPEYVVEYIVDETLGPLVDEIREDLMSQSADTTHSREGGFADKFAERIFDLAVLDPAMGSGHFPVNAVDYLARKIIDAQEKQDRQAMDADDAKVRAPTTEDGELRDINWARRKVAQRCIYGVDVNPLATELAKVSLWLRTLAAEQPLAFLDHHLKTGNSLVGSDIEDVLSDGDDDATEDGQLTLQQSFDHTRQRAMEHVTDRFQNLLNIDNETLEDAKEMEAVYDEVRADPLYRKLLAMANVHTADAFGLDVPDDADERMARALHSDAWENIEEQDWFNSAQAMAEDERFFHWELEFPIAFYNQNGERKENPGFDAVIGNPPYVSNWELTESNEELVSTLEKLYPEVASGHWDLFVPFCYKAIKLTKKNGRQSFITPTSLGTEKYGTSLRKKLVEEYSLHSLTHFGEHQIFEEVDRQYLIYLASPIQNNNQKVKLTKYNSNKFNLQTVVPQKSFAEYSNFSLRPSLAGIDLDLKQKIDSESIPLGTVCCVNVGVVAHAGEHSELEFQKSDVIHDKNRDGYKRYIQGSNISRYLIDWDGEWIDYDSKRVHFHRPKFPELFESNKIVVPRVSGSGNRIEASYDRERFYNNDNVTNLILWSEQVKELQTPKGFKPIDNASDYSLVSILGVINSSLCAYYFSEFLATGTLQGSYTSVYPEDLRKMPIISNLDERDPLDAEVRKIQRLKSDRSSLNLNLLDYLGNYKKGPNLPDIGLYQPTETNLLDTTTEDYEKLQIERARTKRDGSTIIIEATARYKPEDEDEFETDTYGYTETEFFEAFTLTNLSEKEAALVEAFVPVAVGEEIGGFRDNATKTNSLIDRLKGMTLPDPDDVADDLRRYIETKERADELDEKIEKTDQLIDEIVYDLYDLTDEEIEIVEEAVADD